MLATGDHPSPRRLAAERMGSGARLVLVHGFTQTRRSWSRLAEDLARDHEVVLVDAPGHGDSSAVDADLWETAALLAEAGGSGTYVGYSMGARLVLHAALACPQSVTRLVLLGATPGIRDESERAARRIQDERLATSIETDGLETFLDQWLTNPLFSRLPAHAAQRDDRLRNSAAGLAASLRRCGTGTQDDLWPRLGELRIPVLVMAGALDGKFAAIAGEMVPLMGPNAHLELVPDAGHAAHLEQPERFLTILRDWLARTGTPN